MYATVGDVKEQLRIDKSDDDALIADLILRAQRYIESKTRHIFESDADTTRYLDATSPPIHGLKLYLPAPLSAITTITNGDGTEVTSDQYVTCPRDKTPYYAIEILPSSSVTWQAKTNGDWQKAITITGRWAYSTTAPPDVAEACKEYAAFLYREKDSLTRGVAIISEGGARAEPMQMPQSVKDVILAYRPQTWDYT